MTSDRGEPDDRRPSRAVAFAVSALLVAAWGLVRLVLFDTTVFPLAYAIPLLIGVWTRDRVLHWTMAAIFVVFHHLKLFWLVEPGVLSEAELWASYGATMANILVATVAVDMIIRLRERLGRTLSDVRAQADELAAQGEELTQQNEELATQSAELSQQTEELTQQGEELASQNEELQTQAEEISALAETIERRERLLHTLLETARLSGTEGAALEQIAAAARELFGSDGVAVAVYERVDRELRLGALAGGGGATRPAADATVADDFVELVLSERRTASLSDAALRPDLSLAALPGEPRARAVLAAPVSFGDASFGAVAVYHHGPHEFTEEEFRLAEWLADQCARMLQTLRAQSELRDADQRKTEFLATLSHELRNPLAPLGFALKLIETTPEHHETAIRAMRRQVQQLVRLVDDLLDVTRLSRNKIQIRRGRVDLVGIVQQVVDAGRPDVEAARHAIALELPSEPVWIDADGDRIAQVMTNLLNNAVRYTPAGGKLTVRVSHSGRVAALSVLDSGIGLDPADVEHVFDMFTQVGGPGSGGLGIGLALVRGIVELHGGKVEAHSDGKGRGTEFRVMLPLAADAQVETDRALPSAPRSARSSRILVVDDNVDSADMMGALLEMHGHTVRVAHDAQTALAAVNDFEPDTALLDIGLPDMDGYELAHRLRQNARTQRMRLIAVTGWGQDKDRTRARDAGFDAHLTKPADPDVLLSVLNAPEAP